MSTPIDDYLACDDHQRVYLIGASCPDCDEPERAAYIVTRARVEARELAKRWARTHHVARVAEAARSDAAVRMQLDGTGGESALLHEPLTWEEQERLFAWVREREDVFAAAGGYLQLAAELGITDDDAAALCESVWPS